MSSRPAYVLRLCPQIQRSQKEGQGCRVQWQSACPASCHQPRRSIPSTKIKTKLNKITEQHALSLEETGTLCHVTVNQTVLDAKARTKGEGCDGQVLTAVRADDISLWVCTIFRKFKDHGTELAADQKHRSRVLAGDRKWGF